MKPIALGYVDHAVWSRCHEIARGLDVDSGGNYDPRTGGAINMWATPRNKPKGYDTEITRGNLRHPANYFAALTLGAGSWEAQPVMLQIHDYERVRAGKREPTTEDVEWCREQWRSLKEAADAKVRD